MCAFVVLGLDFPYQAKRLAWGMSPKFCVKWDVKRQLNHSVAPFHVKLSSCRTVAFTVTLTIYGMCSGSLPNFNLLLSGCSLHSPEISSKSTDELFC